MASPESPDRPQVSDAVILMAGSGSRLRGKENETPPKPLTPILGRPLISYIFESLATAGIRNIHAIVGYRHEVLVAGIRPLLPTGLNLDVVLNEEWPRQNGVSVLAAASRVKEPFLLSMSDHLFDQAVVETLLAGSLCGQINVAVDRKIASIYDLDDAMKVQTSGDRVTAIGKTLTDYDAIDTGLFVIAADLFGYLKQASINDDCSLADGVRIAARLNKARVVDIKEAWWQDVDTPEMLAEAERHLLARTDRNRVRPGRTETSNAG